MLLSRVSSPGKVGFAQSACFLPRCAPAPPREQPGLAGRAHAGHDLPRRLCQRVDNLLLRSPPRRTQSGTRLIAAQSLLSLSAPPRPAPGGGASPRGRPGPAPGGGVSPRGCFGPAPGGRPALARRVTQSVHVLLKALDGDSLHMENKVSTSTTCGA